MATKPCIRMVPVEIWRVILRYAVGPSLSNPEQDTLRAYDALVMNYKKLSELYITKEQIRHKLMLVCILWRDIVEEMDDKIVIGGMDYFDWPPNKQINEAKYIHYIKHGRELHSQDIISRPRGRGELVAAIHDPYSWRNKTLELVINAEFPPAPVMLVGSMKIKLGRDVSTAFNGRVRVFQWILPSEDTDVAILRTPLFDNLTYLALSVYRHHDFPQELVQLQWTFPTLRALVIRHKCRDTNQNDVFGQWHCPKLTMLKYAVGEGRNPVPSSMIAFINKNAQNLEELVIFADSKSHWGVEDNWKHLVTLKSYNFTGIHQLVDALPFMRGLWSEVDNTSATRRLHLEVAWKFRSEAPSILCARAAQYEDLLAKLDLRLTLSWRRIWARATAGREEKQKVVDFLAIVDELKLNVVDVDDLSLDSPEARELRENLPSANSEDELYDE